MSEYKNYRDRPGPHWASLAQRNNALKQVSEGKMSAEKFKEYDVNWAYDMIHLPERKHEKKEEKK